MASIIAVFCLTLLMSTTWAQKFDHENGTGCMCAVFMTEESSSESQPIYSNTVFEPGCDSAAGEMCRTMCVNLAKMAGDKAPSMLCSFLQGRVDPFKVSLKHLNYIICNLRWNPDSLLQN